jgi:hypothetical protein
MVRLEISQWPSLHLLGHPDGTTKKIALEPGWTGEDSSATA